MVSIIGIIGKKQAGKNTCADYLCKHHDFIKLAFAPLKKVTKKMFGSTNHDLYADTVDKEFFNKGKEKIWIHRMDKRIKQYNALLKEGEKLYIVICDVQFQDEIDWIKSNGGAIFKVQQTKRVEEANNGGVNAYKSKADIDNLKNVNEIILNVNTKQDLYKQLMVCMCDFYRIK